MALPMWLMWLSSAARAVAFAAAASILYDIVRCTRRMMAIMTGVWPITALYRGPVAIWAYRTRAVSPAGSVTITTGAPPPRSLTGTMSSRASRTAMAAARSVTSSGRGPSSPDASRDAASALILWISRQVT